DAVPMGDGSLQIEVNGIQRHLLIEHGLDPEKPDNRIIGAALGQRGIGPTVMVSNDAALRIKAAHLGVDAREHRPSRVAREIQPMGWRVIDVEHNVPSLLCAHRLTTKLAPS
ncbi:MAG: PIN domain-containing protein, partial [Ilumatobacteraceae bacterium]